MLDQVLISMRPKQWTKNLFVFAAVAFTGNLFNLPLFLNAILAFFIFCCLSGSVYIINDVIDRKADKQHPQKKERPIAAGKLDHIKAIKAAIIIAFAGLAFSFFLPLYFVISAVAYLVLLFCYSLFLKDIIIIDAMTVSIGFVLRLLAGGFAISIISSPWSLIMVFFLAMFMSLVKRRVERESLGDLAIAYRKSLAYYRKETLDYIVVISATSVIIFYALFSLFFVRSQHLYVTLPFVVYGVFRYMYLAFEKNMGRDPSVLFLEDKPLLLDVIGWIVTSIVVIYSA